MEKMQSDDRHPVKQSNATSVISIAIEGRSLQAGWMSYVPSSFIPYLQLMRLDRFNGYWYFWLPHLYGTIMGAIEVQASPMQLLQVNFVMFWAVLVMRGAVCTFNDAVDAPFDRQVSRCKNRPVARGAVSELQAHAFSMILSAVSLLFLKFLDPLCALYAPPAVVGWILYPLAKRVTYYPQVVLGIPMAWGIFMGASAIGADPLNVRPFMEAILMRANWSLAIGKLTVASPAIVAFYLANASWTLLYETIYSHQDAAEDISAGVKNIVLLYTEVTGGVIKFKTKPLLVQLAALQVFLLYMTGIFAQFGTPYFVGTVCGTVLTTFVVLYRVQLHVPANCAWWFRVGCCFSTGTAMASGLVGEYLVLIMQR